MGSFPGELRSIRFSWIEKHGGNNYLVTPTAVMLDRRGKINRNPRGGHHLNWDTVSALGTATAFLHPWWNVGVAVPFAQVKRLAGLHRATPNAAYLKAGVAVLRKRSRWLHDKAGVDGFAQGVEGFLCQSDTLP